jgi:hypothetical protein
MTVKHFVSGTSSASSDKCSPVIAGALVFVVRTLIEVAPLVLSDIPAVLVLALGTLEVEVWAFFRGGCNGCTKCLFPLIAFAVRYRGIGE